MGLDSVELVMAFEEEFEIEIPDAAAEEMVSVRDVRDFVVAELARNGREITPAEAFERVRKLIVEHGNLDPDVVTLDADIVGDLGIN